VLIQMLVYPDMTLLDLVGPAQVWSLWPEAEIQFVWKDTRPLMSDCGLAVVPTRSFGAAASSPESCSLRAGSRERRARWRTPRSPASCPSGARGRSG
jgi:hypothetical protein